MIKSQIEDNAKEIRHFLEENQISSVFEIEKQLSMQRQDILMALGWLAREDKIYFIGGENNCKIMIIEDMHDE